MAGSGWIYLHRGHTAADWTSANPVLMAREIGIETDTRKIKIGDGTSAWTALSYLAADASSIPAAGITDATAAGRALLTAATVAAQRTSLGLGTLALASAVTAAEISDATAAGRALLTAATVAAQRTALGLGALATASAVTAAQISDATTAGRNLLTAADATAQRTALGLGALATASGVTASQISDATTAGRNLLTAADATAQRTALGLGTLALASSVTASQVSDATTAGRNLLTAADVPSQRTSLGLGTLALASSVTASQISDATAAGRNLLTAADATAQRTALGLAVFTTSAAGLVPASPGGTAAFLRADGTFAVPPGGGGGGPVAWADVTGKPTTATGYGFATGIETTMTAAYTLDLTDEGKTLLWTTSATLTIPDIFPAGFQFTVSATSSVTVALSLGGTQTVDRDLNVLPSETTRLTKMTTGAWRRDMVRGFGHGSLAIAGYRASLTFNAQPSGISRADSTTTGIADRPSHLGTACIVRTERHNPTRARETIWDYANPALGLFWRLLDGATVGPWYPEGLPSLPTASLPTNLGTGSVIFNTTTGRLQQWSGSAWVDLSMPATPAWADITGKPGTMGALFPNYVSRYVNRQSTEALLFGAGAGGALGTLTNAEGRVVIYPWVAPCDLTITALAARVSSANATDAARLGVYASDANQLPTNLLASGTIVMSSSGRQNASIGSPLSFEGGKTYWFAAHTTGATGVLNAHANGGAWDISASGVLATSKKSLLRVAVTYSGGLPDPWGYVASEVNSQLPIAIWGILQ